jgi:phosphate transport system substrate-binding protein
MNICLCLTRFFLALSILWSIASCNVDKAQILRIKGSDTEVNVTVLLAEAFVNKYPEKSISVSGGGSGLGIASLMNGLTDIANSSREMNAFESSMLKQRQIEVLPVVFAQDALAILVNEQLDLEALTVNDLRQIFSGHSKNWSRFAGLDKPIHLYGRQSNSGTHDYFKKRLDIEFSLHAREMNGNSQIIEAIKSDPTGIGYVGVGYVMKDGVQNIKGVKVLSISEKGEVPVSPLDLKAVDEGRYVFQRPLFEYIRMEALERAKPFLEFVKSPAGQAIIIANGYFPAPSASVHGN